MVKPLVQHTVYIDLPGEPVKCAAGTDVTVLLRKHRDVVFDIKLQAGATYTITATHPDRSSGRFYDPQRKSNVAKTTFKDGEICHVWISRAFEGSLVLKHGEKVLGRYPVNLMDCTKSCTEDPKDKPAPMFIVLHDDQAFVKDLQALSDVPELGHAPASPILANAFAQVRESQGTEKNNAILNDARRRASAPVPYSDARVADARVQGVPSIHAFKIKQTSGPDVPKELLDFFASGAETFKWDPFDTLSRNFILAQISGGFAYMSDTIWNGPLKGFWNRAFIIQRTISGEFVLLFSTSVKETRILGYLLGVYKTYSHDIKVMTIAGGAGSLSATWKASKMAAKASISTSTATGKALMVTIAMDTIAWLRDSEAPSDGGKPKRDFAKLIAAIGSDYLQMWITTYAATWVVSLLLGGAASYAAGAAVGATVGSIAIGTLALIVIIGFFVGVLFNWGAVNVHLTNMIKWIGEHLERQLPGDYGDSYSNSSWRVFSIGATP
ncbi:hypothetical protein DM39_291 [Burkholderia cenocepacia]|uniref:Uncharacterized protein n=1 Tax=Burkholderia cenocepacia TaxID=95486 RepID=A0AAN0RSN4_9BURK|nr:hypothetical protein DM39_291 [Burkholderia cenocepacia]